MKLRSKIGLMLVVFCGMWEMGFGQCTPSPNFGNVSPTTVTHQQVLSFSIPNIVNCTMPTVRVRFNSLNYQTASGQSGNYSIPVPCNVPPGPATVRIRVNTSGANYTSNAQPITILPLFSYNSASYCIGVDANPTPTVLGGATGTFSINNNGTINPMDGTINLPFTVPGTYTVTFIPSNNPCGPVTQTVTITAGQAHSIQYSSLIYCKDDGPVTPQTCAPAACSTMRYAILPFVSAMNGFDHLSGEIDLDVIPAGTYRIAGYTQMTCSTPAYATVEVQPREDPTFNYPANNNMCRNQLSVSPASITTLGGTFQIQGNQNFATVNNQTGTLTLHPSSPSSIPVVYTTGGTCPSSDTVSVAVVAPKDPTFTLSSILCPYNASTDTAVALIPPGVFYSPDSGLVFTNPSQGIIDLANSNHGQTYTIFYRTTGSGCQDTSSQYVTISAIDSVQILKTSNTVCSTMFPDSILTVTNSSTGIYSSTGFGIDPNSGVLLSGPPTAGRYEVQYVSQDSGCLHPTATDSLDYLIATKPDFGYPQSIYCIGDTAFTPAPTVAPAGGTFSSQPSGLTFGSQPGSINLNPSAAGLWQITYSVAGACPADSTVTIEIFERDDASFSYPLSTYCLDSTNNPGPQLPIAPGGIFLGSQSGVVDSISGVIDLGAAMVDTMFVVAHFTIGHCPDTATDTLDIVDQASANFEYQFLDYCEGTDTIVPTVDQQIGTFSAPPGIDVHPSTGAVILGNSTVGNYTVTYEINTSGCNAIYSRPFNIIAESDPTFCFVDSVACPQAVSFCINAGANPQPVSVAQSGGVFDGDQIIWDVKSIGKIDLNSTGVGVYEVIYHFTDACENADTVEITILDKDDASFAYEDDERFCLGESNPSPIAIGLQGGTFSTVDLGIALDSTSGIINLDSSEWGTYTVNYTTNGMCPNSSNRTIQLLRKPNYVEWAPTTIDTICEGEQAWFEVPTLGNNLFEFSLDETVVISRSSNSILPLNDMNPGSYDIQVVFTQRTNQVCTDTLDGVLLVNERPSVYLTTPQSTIVNGDTALFSASSSFPGTHFIWEAGRVENPDSISFYPRSDTTASGMGAFDLIGPVVQMRDTLTPNAFKIFVLPISQFGCEGMLDSLTFTLNPGDEDLFIPEFISPNGDGLNDTWKIQWKNTINSENFTIDVYNRAGGRIMHSEYLTDQWNGGNTPDGVHWYVIKEKTGERTWSGGLTIKRVDLANR